ncbi:calcium-binding protein [Patulibacter americanus]|uniref:calcium-binding protein n=1 Tax=Patulibacter americanus TaxID=588672 RepID=UPI0003B72B0C|nr:calcium-binding protein [Patulibacter americanus]
MPSFRSILDALRPLLLVWSAMLLAGLVSGAAEAVAAPLPSDEARALCGPARPGELCAAGAGRQTPGGGEKVSHAGWPAITGILWKVEATHDAAKTGGAENDELLGHHGSDRIAGGSGRDVLWGDWDPKDNGSGQRDVLDGGAGADWLYSSHGHNVLRGGPGNDVVWAYYGRGTIDCGPGYDTLRVRLVNDYRYRGCERVVNFCAFGSKPGGGCYRPGEKPRARVRLTPRRAR